MYIRDSCFRIAVLALLLAATPGCRSLFEREESKVPVVFLAQHDTAIRCSVLVRKSVKLKATILPKGALPYSENSNAALWIGTQFDYKKAIEVLRYCNNYYPAIRYIAFSDIGPRDFRRGRYELFLGAPTDRALCLGLKPWTLREKRRLLLSRSREQFEKLIRSKAGAPKRCINPDRGRGGWLGIFR